MTESMIVPTVLPTIIVIVILGSVLVSYWESKDG